MGLGHWQTIQLALSSFLYDALLKKKKKVKIIHHYPNSNINGNNIYAKCMQPG